MLFLFLPWQLHSAEAVEALNGRCGKKVIEHNFRKTQAERVEGVTVVEASPKIDNANKVPCTKPFCDDRSSVYLAV